MRVERGMEGSTRLVVLGGLGTNSDARPTPKRSQHQSKARVWVPRWSCRRGQRAFGQIDDLELRKKGDFGLIDDLERSLKGEI